MTTVGPTIASLGSRLTTTQRRAALLVIGASAIWSLGAVTNRLADGVDAWQYLFWRSIGVVVSLEMLSRYRGRSSPMVAAWTSGRRMIGPSLGLLAASMGYVYAVKNTTAANAAFFSSLTPFVAAGLAWALLHERPSRITWITLSLAMAGLALVVWGPSAGARVGDGIAATTRGNLAALCCSFGFAAYMICVRTDTKADWAPSMPGYCSLMIPICATVTLIKGNTLIPAGVDIVLALIHGGVFIVIGTLLFNLGSKRVSTTALSVFSQTEFIAVPLLILLMFGESPSLAAFLGGLVILGAVIVQAVGEKHAPTEPLPG
jgi:drug/metabolite transporter, DME family